MWQLGGQKSIAHTCLQPLPRSSPIGKKKMALHCTGPSSAGKDASVPEDPSRHEEQSRFMSMEMRPNLLCSHRMGWVGKDLKLIQFQAVPCAGTPHANPWLCPTWP